MKRRGFLGWLLKAAVAVPALPAILEAGAKVTPVRLSGRQGPPGACDGLAERARLWFLEAQQHPLWKKYRNERKEDIGFYSGGRAQSSIRPT